MGAFLLPSVTGAHICVAWAVGGLLAYVAEWYRRQMYRSQRLAAAAHAKELLEAQVCYFHNANCAVCASHSDLTSRMVAAVCDCAFCEPCSRQQGGADISRESL
jgi:hypothetical protein